MHKSYILAKPFLLLLIALNVCSCGNDDRPVAEVHDNKAHQNTCELLAFIDSVGLYQDSSTVTQATERYYESETVTINIIGVDSFKQLLCDVISPQYFSHSFAYNEGSDRYVSRIDSGTLRFANQNDTLYFMDGKSHPHEGYFYLGQFSNFLILQQFIFEDVATVFIDTASLEIGREVPALGFTLLHSNDQQFLFHHEQNHPGMGYNTTYNHIYFEGDLNNAQTYQTPWALGSVYFLSPKLLLATIDIPENGGRNYATIALK